MITPLIIFTMQTGFALVESGVVRSKNEVNIMMKNVVDVCFGGMSYYIFGFALMFGRGLYTTPFLALGDFVVDGKVGDPLMGQLFTFFFYQMSFATTSTTIVSGACAERWRFQAYCLFSFINSVVYSVSGGWVWGEHGFLRNLGVVDFAGAGPIHIVSDIKFWNFRIILFKINFPRLVELHLWLPFGSWDPESDVTIKAENHFQWGIQCQLAWVSLFSGGDGLDSMRDHLMALLEVNGNTQLGLELEPRWPRWQLGSSAFSSRCGRTAGR